MARTHWQTRDAGRRFAAAEALMRGYRAAPIGRSGYIEVNGHKTLVQAVDLPDPGWRRSSVLAPYLLPSTGREPARPGHHLQHGVTPPARR